MLGHQSQPAAKRPGWVVDEPAQRPGQAQQDILRDIFGVGRLQAALAAPALDLGPVVRDERSPCSFVDWVLADAPRSATFVCSDGGLPISASTGGR